MKIDWKIRKFTNSGNIDHDTSWSLFRYLEYWSNSATFCQTSLWMTPPMQIATAETRDTPFYDFFLVLYLLKMENRPREVTQLFARRLICPKYFLVIFKCSKKMFSVILAICQNYIIEISPGCISRTMKYYTGLITIEYIRNLQNYI